MRAEEFYFAQLGKDERRLYREMYAGLMSLEPQFPMQMAEGSALTKVFTLIRLDHPEIFWAVAFKYSFVRGADTIMFEPEYLFRKKQIEEHRRALEARVKRLTAPAASKSEAEKELYLHDTLLQAVHYDKLKKPYSHEVIGPLTQGVGVCEGIAKSVKLLCDSLGIWCITVLCDNAPEKGIKYRHAWNMVKINGKYYHLDATFDLSLSKCGVTRYDYFNVSDSFVFRDHEPSLYPIPASENSKAAYYADKKLVFTDFEKLESRAKQAAAKGKSFVFQWRGGFFTREILLKTAELFENYAREKGRSAVFAVNMPQGVVAVSYENAGTAGGITEQEANEGETL